MPSPYRVSQVCQGLTLPLAFLVLATILATNAALVAPAIYFEQRVRVSSILKRLHPGATADQLLTFLAWGVLGAMLVLLYDQIRPWALVAFLAPTLLGRQVLARSQMFLETRRDYKHRETALTEMVRRVQDERTDERRLIAADLHDDVLQPLFKVTLMAHVLKTDLARGQLVDIDQDLPELLSSAEVASSTLRDLIGDLRRSTLGRGGLAPALDSLVRSLGIQTSSRIHAEIHPVALGPQSELTIYQIAKEGLANSLTHARADNVWIRFRAEQERAILRITDDGIGFDPLVAREGHYGLHIMRERAIAVSAVLYLDSAPGKGCDLTLEVPISNK